MSPTAHPTYDPAALAELRECDPDGSLAAELIGVFLEDTPKRIQALHMAFDAGDPSALAHEAHALKSSCAQLGALRLSDHCRWLEQTGREGSLRGVGDRLQLVDAEWVAVVEALRAVMKRGA
jgi:HPt (histidine-containing phosphotransfer) domain-containing protein